MNLAQARKRAGLTQAELAVKVGTERSHISRIETHEQEMTGEMAERIAPHLGVDSYTLKTLHTCEALKAILQRLGDLPSESLRGAATKQGEDFAKVLKHIRELITDDDVPANVKHHVVKAADRLVGAVEAVARKDVHQVKTATAVEERDIFGRRRW